MGFLRMSELDLRGKRVLIREDLNAPVADGKITSDVRLQAVVPTIQLALEKGAQVMLMSHRGRPTEGEYDAAFSLQPMAEHLSTLLNRPVRLLKDYLDGVEMTVGEVVLFENVRFNVGEKKNDPALSEQLAQLCDVFVHDAFGTAHRAQASTHGVAEKAAVACAGPLLASELDALNSAVQSPQRPLVAIVGGSKVSGKLEVLEKLAQKVDQLIVGGGIANTFLAAQGKPVGRSLYEPELVEKAKEIMAIIEAKGGSIPLPEDVVVAKAFGENEPATLKAIDSVADDDMIFDVGPETVKHLTQCLRGAGTIVWNGPLGVFEFEQFAEGTRALSLAIADSEAFSIAGGGDTLAAVEKYKVGHQISYISTGGGAFLEFLEGKELPAVAVLKAKFAAVSH